MRTARETDRPVLLSVGYSACHWCHVMAHECFEDPAIAALMNELFVNIKVDREERPDVDAVYMEAVQAMTGQGGWPMTVFLTPAGAPYFGGTYFPPRPRGGLPGFPAVLRAAHDAYSQGREDVERIGAEIRRALAPPPLPAGDDPSAEVVTQAVARLVEQSDAGHGGFGGAPKFPHPAALDCSSAAASGARTRRPRPAPERPSTGCSRAASSTSWVAASTATASTRGGRTPLREDALRQRPAGRRLPPRSSADRRSRVPPRGGGHPRSRRPGDAPPEGGFASSQDADSEGAEGRYFVWTPEQVGQALADGDDARLACRIFGVPEHGNFEDGSSVPSLALAPAELAAELGIDRDDAARRVDVLRRRLLASRSRRVAPGRDGKVVTAWNGLALRAFAEAGAALARQDYVEIAKNCAGFLLGEVVVEGRLRRSWMAGAAGVSAFLEDVTFLGDGPLAVYEATGDASHYEHAVGLAEEAAARFRDPDGGYFDTAADAEPLLVRPRGLEDNPLPAGRSMAAQLFLRLAGLTGEERWRDRAREMVRPLVPAIARGPLALGSLACVLDQLVAPSREVAIVGPPDDAATRALLREVWARRDPYRAVAWGAGGSVPLLTGRSLVQGRPAAYVCEGFVCRAPTTKPGELARQL